MANIVTIRITQNFLASYEANSLLETLANKTSKCCGLVVHLEFIETPDWWRADNNGPNFWMMPEFAVREFLTDILYLQRQGIKISVGTKSP